MLLHSRQETGGGEAVILVTITFLEKQQQPSTNRFGRGSLTASL